MGGVLPIGWGHLSHCSSGSGKFLFNYTIALKIIGSLSAPSWSAILNLPIFNTQEAEKQMFSFAFSFSVCDPNPLEGVIPNLVKFIVGVAGCEGCVSLYSLLFYHADLFFVGAGNWCGPLEE